MEDAYLKKMKEKVEARLNIQFTMREDGILMIGNRVCVLDSGELKKQIMNKVHIAPYTMYPDSTKMY